MAFDLELQASRMLRKAGKCGSSCLTVEVCGVSSKELLSPIPWVGERRLTEVRLLC